MQKTKKKFKYKDKNFKYYYSLKKKFYKIINEKYERCMRAILIVIINEIFKIFDIRYDIVQLKNKTLFYEIIIKLLLFIEYIDDDSKKKKLFCFSILYKFFL